MAFVKSESRCRVGISWYDNEAEAVAVAEQMMASPGLARAIADANVGYVQCGRDPAFDLKDEGGNRVAFAVVTP